MILVGLYVSCVGSNMFGKIQKNDRNMSKKDREMREFQFCDRQLFSLGSTVLTFISPYRHGVCSYLEILT